MTQNCLHLGEKQSTHKIDCSLAVNYGKEKKRMCKYFKYNCANCPLHSSRNGFNISCHMMVEEKPTEAIAIVQKWSDEHPVKTIKEDFLEKYPNAPLQSNKVPKSCPYHLGYEERCKYTDCEICWNRPLSEVTK